MGQVNTIHIDRFIIWDSDGNAVTGLTDFTVYLNNHSGTEVSGIIPVTIIERGNGIYESSFTPDVEGTWSLKILNATYLPTGLLAVYIVDDSSFDSIEDKLDIIDANVDGIKAKTDELPDDLAALLANIQAVVDATYANIDIMLGLTDSNKIMDEQTYVNGRLTSARIRVFTGNTLTVVLATFALTGAYDISGNCIDYRVVKV